MAPPQPPHRRTTSAVLLAAYDAQLRTSAEVNRADSWDTDGPLVRAIYDDSGFVTYADLGGHVGPALDRLIARTIAHFETAGVASFEWKSRGHDAPVDLSQRLLAHGFLAEDPETVMVGVAARLAAPVELPPGVSLRQAGAAGADDKPVQSADRLSEDVLAVVELSQAAFGTEGPGADHLIAQLRADPEHLELWLAEADGRVISSGRLDVVVGTDFAGLWGGATHPAWRGRGIYRALTAVRARSAVARGVRYLHSDCTAMSRPILERSGLTAITTTTPYVYTFPADLA